MRDLLVVVLMNRSDTHAAVDSRFVKANAGSNSLAEKEIFNYGDEYASAFNRR
jgi:hypothetical protein